MSRMSSLKDLRKKEVSVFRFFSLFGIISVLLFLFMQEDEDEEEKRENQFFAGGLDNRG
jgi:hypothetical protein